MFKKILLIGIVSILGFGVVGCSDSNKNEVVKKEKKRGIIRRAYSYYEKL